MQFTRNAKKSISLLLSMAIIVVMTFAGTEIANAETKTTTDDGNFQYSIGDDGTITIEKYLGNDEEVVIPETIEGMPVKVIGRSAFESSEIKSVSGKSITKLMGKSFGNCKSLVSVTLPALQVIGTMVNNYIYYGAFYNCSAIIELNLPSVTHIDIYSFVGCDSLKIIDVPNLENLSKYTFTSSTNNNGEVKNLKSIESIKIPCVLYNANKASIENSSYTGYEDCFHSGYALKPVHEGDWTTIKEPTCSVVGKKERECTACGNKETEEVPIDSTAHSYGEWKITKEPTCSAVGEKARECTACGNKETEEVLIDSTAHSFTNYVYNNDAKVGVDGTETAVCDNGCGATDIRTKNGTALSGGGSSGGGGGFIPSITVQKPTISTGDGYTVSTGSDGTTATIDVQEGYELVDVVVNGISKGKVTTLTGLKTGDKVEVKVVKKEELSEVEKVQAALATVTVDNFKARSKQVKLKNGKKAVKITWSNTSGVKFDGVEVFRSVKRYSGYGKKPVFSTEKNAYYNTAIKKGTKYYYKVRGYVEVDGIKYYSAWSKKAWRTVK